MLQDEATVTHDTSALLADENIVSHDASVLLDILMVLGHDTSAFLLNGFALHDTSVLLKLYRIIENVDTSGEVSHFDMISSNGYVSVTRNTGVLDDPACLNARTMNQFGWNPVKEQSEDRTFKRCKNRK